MFVLLRDQGESSDFCLGLSRYRKYLLSNKHRLPASAYEFAMAEWHYNFNDHRCPHDSWVNALSISESCSGVRSEVRRTQISIELLGAYHDGVVKINYQNVLDYTLSSYSKSHGDWLYDEVRVFDKGCVVHEIDLEFSQWKIECEDIKFEWAPFADGI